MNLREKFLMKLSDIPHLQKYAGTFVLLALPSLSFSFLHNTMGPGGSYGQFMIYASLAGYFGGTKRGVLFGALFLPLGIYLGHMMNVAEANIILNNTITSVFLISIGGAFGHLSGLKKTLKEALLKAEESSQIKASFLANMNHEIRTPMNAIIGVADLLSETQLSDEQEKYVTIFKKAGENLLSIVDDILDLAKIESGGFLIENNIFNLREQVKDICAQISARVENKGLQFHCVVDRHLMNDFVGDVDRIKQILGHILLNAYKFTEKGEIYLTVTKNNLVNRTGSLLFSIKDTGIGISKEKQRLLFLAFSQVDSGVAKKFGGAGLGLAICKRLVNLMGGEIWVESEEGKGSQFSFTVNCTEATSANNKMTESTHMIDVEQPLEILLVDDSEDNRALVKAYLKNFPHQIVEAENGEQAVQKAREARFDVIFMDIQMPVLDGYAATRLIRIWEKENGKMPVLIIALTAYTQKEDQEKCFIAGCDAHISKPLKKQVLVERLARVSARKKVEAA